MTGVGARCLGGSAAGWRQRGRRWGGGEYGTSRTIVSCVRFVRPVKAPSKIASWLPLCGVGVGEVGERKRAVAQGGVWYRAESG